MSDLRIETAHTSELAPETLATVRGLVERVFAHVGWTDADWEHLLGGMHALAWSGAELIGHVAVVQRRLLHGGRTLRTGYVEGLAIRADHRRHGHAGALMDVAERVVRGAYELGALGATDEAVPFYDGRGWLRWRGPTFALTPSGTQRTEGDDDAVFVLPVDVELDLDAEIACDWREGDV
jgi:aminoglycoside 2'-N-acetyltransferase I